jgi:nucleoid-associated protein YgaU
VRRENKLALIVGFSVLLVVAVLVSDHLSTARQDEVEAGLDTLLEIPGGKAFVTEPLRAEGRVGRGADLGDSPRFATGERVNPTETQVAQAETSRAAGRATPRYSDPTPTRSAPTETLGTPELVERYASSSSAGNEPIQFGNGPGASDDSDDGGMTRITGVEQSVIDKLLSRQQTALVQTSDDDRRPGSQIAGGTTDGLVARDNKYVIQPNDTLFEVCQRLYGDGTKWRELVAINNGKIRDDGTVFPGVAIDLVPGVRQGAIGGASRSETPERAPEQSEGETRSYTVKKGDTLSEIVQREVGSIRHLERVRTLNPWLEKQKDNIRVGQKLVLPTPRHASARGR